jgi:hypothetical protein
MPVIKGSFLLTASKASTALWTFGSPGYKSQKFCEKHCEVCSVKGACMRSLALAAPLPSGTSGCRQYAAPARRCPRCDKRCSNEGTLAHRSRPGMRSRRFACLTSEYWPCTGQLRKPHRGTQMARISLANDWQITTFRAPPGGFDPLTASQADLQRHGFPPRPDE